MTNINKKIRQPIRWLGSKYKLRAWVIEHFPPHETYVEVFGGAGSVLLAKPPAKIEVYNDVNSDLVLLFRVLRDPVQSTELRRLLDLTPYSKDEYNAAFNVSADPIERARQIIVIGAMGFGSCNLVSRRGFCHPIKGRNYGKQYRNLVKDLDLTIERLKDVCIDNADCLALIKKYDCPEALFYLDPPYLTETLTKETLKYSDKMTKEKHIELLNLAKESKGMFVISGYDSDLYNEALKSWAKYTTKSETANNYNYAKKERIECLWVSPNATEAIKKANSFDYIESEPQQPIGFSD